MKSSLYLRKSTALSRNSVEKKFKLKLSLGWCGIEECSPSFSRISIFVEVRGFGFTEARRETPLG